MIVFHPCLYVHLHPHLSAAQQPEGAHANFPIRICQKKRCMLPRRPVGVLERDCLRLSALEVCQVRDCTACRMHMRKPRVAFLAAPGTRRLHQPHAQSSPHTGCPLAEKPCMAAYNSDHHVPCPWGSQVFVGYVRCLKFILIGGHLAKTRQLG